MRITKVYTRTGDKGTTSLADGTRVYKDNLRLESYGTIDELNSIIAICRESCSDCIFLEIKNIELWLFAIQNDLFNLGADLSTPISARWDKMVLINELDIEQLEKVIDYCQESLKPLKEFVIPGGSQLNAFLHLARTVCRRAERITYKLSESEEINPFALVYLNRLSDLLFVMARFVQEKSHKKEILWDKHVGVRTISF